ncbi:hypothetical protein [Helicobacter canis]|uniref:hypothetical protein n=1 Tax=Helicobacter canis TaxID=29419 RepID=UPI002942EAD3|nr:hypothetical protein [Helicobacter canis]
MKLFLKRLALIALCFASALLYADSSSRSPNGYVIGNTHGVLVSKTQELIQLLSAEIFQKTGIRVYVDIIDDIAIHPKYPTKQARKEYQSIVYAQLQQPYVVVSLFVQERKFDLISSSGLQAFLGAKVLDSVYFDYMAPLIPEKEQDITPQRLSAILLNGYAEIADIIASQYAVKFEHNISTNEQGVRSFVRFIMYAMVLILLGLFALAHFSRKSSS